VASTIALAGLSVPNYVLAVVLILFFALGGQSVFGRDFGVQWLPASRYVPFGESPIEHFKHMALPTLALAIGLSASYMRVLRSDMISTLQENFITTAKAKGVPDRRILWGHALRPSSFTLLTVFGLNVAALIGGTLVIEQIFTLPGLGTTLGTAIFQKDFLVVQGVAVVIAVGYTVINSLVDLLYAVLDPRIRHGRA
jgi:peptide/nickel transport system permease protein